MTRDGQRPLQLRGKALSGSVSSQEPKEAVEERAHPQKSKWPIVVQLVSVATPAEPRGKKKKLFFVVQILGGEKLLLKFVEKCR